MVIAPGHQRRIQAGILSWGQDIDHETSPFQCNLAYQVPREKKRETTSAGPSWSASAPSSMPDAAPFAMVMVGMRLGGKPIDDYAPDFWLVSDAAGGDPIGYLTSPWYAPELGCNISLGYVPAGRSAVGTELAVWLPDEYASEPGRPERAQVCEVPFRPSVNPSAREVAFGPGARRDGLGDGARRPGDLRGRSGSRRALLMDPTSGSSRIGGGAALQPVGGSTFFRSGRSAAAISGGFARYRARSRRPAGGAARFERRAVRPCSTRCPSQSRISPPSSRKVTCTSGGVDPSGELVVGGVEVAQPRLREGNEPASGRC